MCKDYDLSEQDIDFLYDEMRDRFLLCEDEKEAKYLIKRYGFNMSNKYLQEKFRYLLEEQKDDK